MEPDIVFGQFRRLTAAVAVLAVLAGCAATDQRPAEIKPAVKATAPVAYLRSGFACCNLRYNGDRVSDSNLAQFPFIAAGTPVKVKSIDGYRVDVEIDGKSIGLAMDHGRKAETIEQWVNKLVVLEDPRIRMERFPAAMRNAIARGQVMKGMTTEQVIMALGYPQADENPDLDARSWRYWWSSFAPYYVYWNKGKTVARIDGHPEAVANMVYKGK